MAGESMNYEIDIDSAKGFLRNEALRKTVPTIPWLPSMLLGFFLVKDLWYLLFLPLVWMYYLQRTDDVILLNKLTPGFQKNYRILLVLITVLCFCSIFSFIFYVFWMICMLAYGVYFSSMFDNLQKEYGVEPDELSKYK